MDGATKTLLVPFETGALSLPEGDWAYLNARAHPDLTQAFAGASLVCEQPMRPDFLDLRRAGLTVVPSLADAPAGRFDGVMVLLGKHRRLNEVRVARAARLARLGAPVLVVGDKALGAASARKWSAGRIALDGSLAKHRALAFWFGADARPFGDVALPRTEPAPGLFAAPGMFSADRIDAGSALLADCIDETIAGDVADLGAGWGYLSAQVLRKGRPGSLALVEAHRPALDAAMGNLAALAGEVAVNGHWLDIACEPWPGPFDWVVTNPPFHAGRTGDPRLGQRFIAAAARALGPDGRLLVVANRHLPYERTLAGMFAVARQVAQGAGFKVIEAARPRAGAREPLYKAAASGRSSSGRDGGVSSAS